MQIIWENFLNILKQEVGIQVVDTWFKSVTLTEWNPAMRCAYLSAPNQFVLNWIQEHYSELIKKTLARLFNVESLSIYIALAHTGHKPNKPAIIPAAPLAPEDELIKSSAQPNSYMPVALRKKNRHHNSQLNPDFTFDNFVVGPNSSLAHAAAYAVSQNLGWVYNPLFIYGHTGLGKTHLLHAVGHETLKKFPSACVIYETSDHFISAFINAIKTDKVVAFRRRYEQIDLLLLDDVQFFSGKAQTQEVMFHIFNHMFNRQKQIVFSSDSLPQDIPDFHDRLRSRMQSGLIADISAPDLETKMAILTKKAHKHGIMLDETTINYLATLSVASVRELEGFLIRIGAYSSLTNQEITVTMAQDVIAQVQEKRKDDAVEIESILKATLKHFKVTEAELKSDKRNKKIAFVRQVAFYMMKKLTVSSLQTIGTYLGGRNHTTVRHAVNKIEAAQKSNPALSNHLKTIERMVVSSG